MLSDALELTRQAFRSLASRVQTHRQQQARRDQQHTRRFRHGERDQQARSLLLIGLIRAQEMVEVIVVVRERPQHQPEILLGMCEPEVVQV